jgi:hypothetical protein
MFPGGMNQRTIEALDDELSYLILQAKPCTHRSVPMIIYSTHTNIKYSQIAKCHE